MWIAVTAGRTIPPEDEPVEDRTAGFHDDPPPPPAAEPATPAWMTAGSAPDTSAGAGRTSVLNGVVDWVLLAVVVAALAAIAVGPAIRDPQFDPSALIGPAVLALVALWLFLVPEAGRRVRMLRVAIAAVLVLYVVAVAVSDASEGSDASLTAVLVPFQAAGVVIGLALALLGFLGGSAVAPLGDPVLLVISAICLTAITACAAAIAWMGRLGRWGRLAAVASFVLALVAVESFATFLLGPDHWGPVEFQDVIDSMAIGVLLVSVVAAVLWIARLARTWRHSNSSQRARVRTPDRA